MHCTFNLSIFERVCVCIYPTVCMQEWLNNKHVAGSYVFMQPLEIHQARLVHVYRARLYIVYSGPRLTYGCIYVPYKICAQMYRLCGARSVLHNLLTSTWLNVHANTNCDTCFISVYINVFMSQLLTKHLWRADLQVCVCSVYMYYMYGMYSNFPAITSETMLGCTYTHICVVLRQLCLCVLEYMNK